MQHLGDINADTINKTDRYNQRIQNDSDRLHD